MNETVNNKIKEPMSRKVFVIFNAVILLLLCCSIILPFLRMASISLSNKGAVLRSEVFLFPKGFTTDVYKLILENGSIGNAYKNTLFVVIIGTIVNVVLTSCGAYVISKPYLPGVKFFTGLIVVTMWFGGGMIPTFLVVQSVGLYNSLWALILPTAISTYHIIIMRTFFNQIPAEIEEAALIDGCNEISTMFKIILPLSKPILATVALWIAVYRWNDFMQPQLYLRNREMFTLQVVLREIVLTNSAASYGMDASAQAVENVSRNVITESLKYGVVIFSSLPIMMIYPFLQKYFTKGVLMGSVKG